MTGCEGHLSGKQQAALDKLKTNLEDIWCDEFTDYYLLRWLRARKFEVKKSEKMLRNSLDWRRRHEVDTILSWTVPEVLTNYYPCGFFGHSKEGNPTLIDAFGYMDLKGMFHSTTKREIVKYRMYMIELAFQRMFPDLSNKFGKKIDQINTIFDMDLIGIKHMWKPAIDTFVEILKALESNYPETLRVAYVVNAPRIFPMLFNLIKPFLSEDTKCKIRILGGSWREQLLKDYDADQLPVNWGGTCKDPDGDIYCRSQICMGGPIPEEYKKTNIAENIDMSNFSSAEIGRGKSILIATVINEPGSILSYNFWTEGMDIGFAIYRRTGNDDQKVSAMEVVVPADRINSHLVPEDGTVVCDKAGTYVTVFDNSYSWMNTKKISYLLEVVDPTMDISLPNNQFVTHL